MTTQPKTPTNAPGMANLPSEESVDGNEPVYDQEERSRETRPLPAADMAATADVSDTYDASETPTSDTPESAAGAAMATPAPQHPDITAVHQDADGDATLLR